MAAPDVVDLDRWIREFQGEELEQHFQDRWLACIASPCHLAFVEHVRAKVLRGLPIPKAVPADIFLFSQGCPERRDLTQIGGLPYRPAEMEWPRGEDGTLLTFLGQMRFAESRDILPPLRGDLLLIFASNEWCHEVYCEWQPLGLEQLATEAEIACEWRIPELWGSRHRTADCADKELPEPIYGCLGGIKIGGLPTYHFMPTESYYFGHGQRVETPQPPHLFSGSSQVEKVTGTFLGAFGSVQPEANIRYPWTNVSQPYSFDEVYENDFVVGDMRGLQLYLQADGQVFWKLDEF